MYSNEIFVFLEAMLLPSIGTFKKKVVSFAVKYWNIGYWIFFICYLSENIISFKTEFNVGFNIVLKN